MPNSADLAAVAGGGSSVGAPDDGRPTACIALASGDIFYGRGFGASGVAAGELCFNTALTGYQEILTDPSYDGQIVMFTFPHIGNVGANAEDDEAAKPVALGLVCRELPTAPANWRATHPLHDWLAASGRIGVAGVDTRRLTRLVRRQGALHAVIAHDEKGVFDTAALVAKAQAFAGLEGKDLASGVSTDKSYPWRQTRWEWSKGYSDQASPRHKVVALDFGAKRNILRLLADKGCDVVVLPATATAEQVLAEQPAGVFLSNGPGDPAATATHAGPVIKQLIDAGLPVFGICLGHQMLALALGAKTVKMPFGHHGANHPVKEMATGKVEVTSMNHGFAVDASTLPDGVIETHVSLFDGSNCGLAVKDKPIFSVQHHPEASPGPQDSHYLFERFVAAMDARASGGA
ncbi:MAG: glutamine-hydrolyzing carbamoyl-phosphate synthase small subunit [Neomegalonema sp.]|nr:glutamine-hydrolyzing carbamoyl-phosphate synthase small subunit [Neomegalonema sp.]